MNPFPAYLAVSCLLAYAIYQFCPGLFPPLRIFTTFLILDFQGLPVAKIFDFPLVIISLEAVPTCSPLMESWLADF
jgi:hypothetical protein